THECSDFGAERGCRHFLWPEAEVLNESLAILIGDLTHRRAQQYVLDASGDFFGGDHELVPEVTLASHPHGHAMFFGSGNDLGITNATTRLDQRGRASRGTNDQSIREREEGITGNDGAFGQVASFVDRDLGRIDATHLTSTDTGNEACAVVSSSRQDDRIRLNVLAAQPRKCERVLLGIRRLALGRQITLWCL